MRSRRFLPLLLGASLGLLACGETGPEAARQDGEQASGDARGTAAQDRFGGQWETDFAKASIDFEEIMDGGPPRDGIPPIDEPKAVDLRAGDGFLSAEDPVMVVEIAGEARAYPIRIMIWHEIANDELAGTPIAVTYCPLCNSAIVYERELDGRTLTFGTTGKLRKSDLVMWDRQTESWWQQFSGEAIVGELTGKALTPVASHTVSWEDFKRAHPDGTVLSEQTGNKRDYGRNPYEGYDASPDEQPFLLEGEVDGRLPPKERVLLVQQGEAAAVLPFRGLERTPVRAGKLGGDPFVAFYKRGVVSALDAAVIADSRDVGTAAAFDPRLAGRTLRFRALGDGRFRDEQTGSTWDITGRTVAGELSGRQLERLEQDQSLWFAVAAFLPDANVLDG